MNSNVPRPVRFCLTILAVMSACILLIAITGSPAGVDAANMGSAAPNKGAAPQSSETPCVPGGSWEVTQTPDGGSYTNSLYSITSVSASDVWAVGEQYSYSLGGFVAIIEHWNGTAWSVVNGSPYAMNLRGVTAISTNDVWAVGWLGGYGSSPFTEHWDGSQWTYVESPASGGRKLLAVSASSTNDVWAVGQSINGVLIMHWDGAHWTPSTVPSLTNGVLTGVAAISNNDVWAVGTINNGETLILHWDGTAWTRTTSPNSGEYKNVLTGISATASDDVWATGYWATSGVDYHGYLLHYDGTDWTAMVNPTERAAKQEANRSATPDDPIPTGTYLYGISAASDGKIWLAGRNLQNTSSTAVSLYYDGDSWTITPNPNPGYANTALYAISARSDDAIWAAGNYDTNSYGYTVPFTERFSASTCPTYTPGVPTNTRTPAPTSETSRTPLNTNTPVATGTPSCQIASWVVVTTPDDGSYLNSLYAVASVADNDTWAVGEQYSSSRGSFVALIEHWNGSAWSVVNGSPYSLNLRGVAAISTNDVWAVGWMGGYGFTPFTEHWDGSSWTYVQSSASGGRRLYAVSAASTDDVWAVGFGTNGVLIMHWNGTQWTPATVPSIPNGILYGVSAVSANDAWAVGTINNSETLIMHWDGSSWSRVTSPNDGEFINVVTAISAVAPDNVWATGYWATSGVDYHGYQLHYDGTEWISYTNPTERPNRAAQPDDPTPRGNYLYGLAASADSVWFVGRNLQDSGSTGLAVYYDGDSWAFTSTANPGHAYTSLYSIAASGTNAPWAVGNFDTGSEGYTEPLAERYVATCATATPAPPSATPVEPTATSESTLTPESTATPGTTSTAEATGTPVSATPEPTGTTTICNISFTDIPASDPFYSQVMCLACKGIMSGYPDGTFRPGNSITRGQLAKIVSNTAGLDGTPTGQTFEDVPEGSTFYMYAERMAEASIITGYPCGGPGEPCGPENRPYFRPSALATRGQISKIVSTAAGFTESPVSQSFEDVAPNSTFYEDIERLASRSVMSGYPCGGPNEPCGAGNLPYFRPSNNATRGQSSKIVANAFYPNCQTP